MTQRREFHPVQAEEIDIIASKRASGRQRDLIELPLLENLRVDCEKRHTQALRAAADLAARRVKGKA